MNAMLMLCHFAWLRQAYREWRNSSYESLFIVNNDVLVPAGVIDALAAALTPEGDLLPSSSLVLANYETQPGHQHTL